MAPVVTVEDLLTSDATPALSGSTDDATANVRVTLGTETYEAINYGDGTWALLDNTISDGLADGTHDVIVAATDAAGNVGMDQTTNELTVDTTPVVSAGENQIIDEGQTVSIEASVVDANPDDTHTAVIDWGDGSTPEAGVVTKVQDAFVVEGNHVYVDDGVYTLRVTVTDSQGKSDQDS